MGRIRKRITKKKSNIKKNIKLPARPKQTIDNKHKLTSEQQAKQNDMLKVMLSRPQQILPQGITQQNDELKQKLDSLTRQNVNQAQENKELRRLIDEGRAETQRIHNEARRQEEVNRILAQNNKEKEYQEDLLHKAHDVKFDLLHTKDLHDTSTLVGQVKDTIDKAKTKIQEVSYKISQNEQTINKNALYQEAERVNNEVDRLTAQLRAQEDIINSDRFKNPRDELKRAYKNEMKAQIKKDENEEIIKRKMNLMKLTAEQQAKQQAYDDYTRKDIRTQQRKKDGTLLFGKNGSGKEYPIYEKDDKGNDKVHSLADEQAVAIAEQVKAQEQAQIELDKLTLEMDNVKRNYREAIQTKISNDNTQRELERMKDYQESDQYKALLRASEDMKKSIELQTLQNQHSKDMLAMDKKMKALAAQAEIRAKFNPSEADTATIQTQIGELGKQYTDILSSNINAANEDNKLELTKVDMHNTLDSLLNKYEGNDRTTANDNLLKLIAFKANSKLPADFDDYTRYHMERATELMKLINERDTDLLLNSDKLNEFINEDTYKHFEWNNVE